jgi:preprotein translocase subunit SecA
MPTHRVCVRREEADWVFVKEEAKWQAVLEQIKVVHGQGRPILVGTRSVRTSERLSGMLKEAGLAHQVLNAVRHAEEAAVVAKAGEAGRITVATNMAGRGTDIKLGSGVAERGGLHVIVTERHEARRVDRQLFGRAGRQGDPGSAATFASMEDELLVRHGGVMRRAWWRGDERGEVRSAMARRLLAMAQWRSGRLAAKRRREVLRADDWLAEHLGFAGAE